MIQVRYSISQTGKYLGQFEWSCGRVNIKRMAVESTLKDLDFVLSQGEGAGIASILFNFLKWRHNSLDKAGRQVYDETKVKMQRVYALGLRLTRVQNHKQLVNHVMHEADALRGLLCRKNTHWDVVINDLLEWCAKPTNIFNDGYNTNN